MATLMDPSNGQRWILRAAQEVGREERCLVRLPGPWVSTVHAAIRWDVDGWKIRDLGSSNGTYVNGRALPLHSWHRLQPADTLDFGDRQRSLHFADDAPPLSLEGREPRITPTQPIDPATPLSECSALFEPSRDGEYVALTIDAGARRHAFGGRAANEMLLELARQKIDDLDQGLPEPSAGWVYQDELKARLKATTSQLDVHIWRLRKKVASFGIRGADDVIERRRGTGQIRTGLVFIQIKNES